MRLTTKNHYSKEAERDVQAAFRPPRLTTGAPHGRNARTAQAGEQHLQLAAPSGCAASSGAGGSPGGAAVPPGSGGFCCRRERAGALPRDGRPRNILECLFSATSNLFK